MMNINCEVFNQILEKVAREDSFFFYNPFKDICYLGINSSQHSLLSAETQEINSFYAIPFWDNSGNQESGEWDTFSFGQIQYSYCYCFRVEQKEVESERVSHHEYEENYQDWKKLFGHIQTSIIRGDIEKAVASRRVEIKLGAKHSIRKMILKLLANDKNSFVFSYRSNGKSFLGATPEVLVEKAGGQIVSYALAGTIPKDGENDKELGQKLLTDKKNNHEHDIVIHAIEKSMKKVTDTVKVGETKLLELKNIFHLKTIVPSCCGCIF